LTFVFQPPTIEEDNKMAKDKAAAPEKKSKKKEDKGKIRLIYSIESREKRCGRSKT
jgi:hypothetical protein